MLTAPSIIILTFLVKSSLQRAEKLPSLAEFRNEVGVRDERCPEVNPQKAKLVPHESECTSYYICESGMAILRECPHELHFNPKKLVCDYPERAGCELENSAVKFRSAIGLPHSDCPPKNPKYPVLLPSTSDCGKFYICDSGLAYEKTCLQGLHFNPKKMVCDFPTDCEDGEQQDLDEDEDDSPKCPKQNSPKPVYLPHPTDCEKFYVCDSGQAHLKECRPGLHFNTKLKVCDFPENSQCSGAKERRGREGATGSPSPFCPTINGKFPIFYPDARNCSIYYMCGNGLAYEFVCPSGLNFNMRLKVCDQPIQANCKVNDIQDTEQ